MLQQLRFYNASQPELFTGEVIRMRMIAPLAVWLVYVCLAACKGSAVAAKPPAAVFTKLLLVIAFSRINDPSLSLLFRQASLRAADGMSVLHLPTPSPI